MYTFIVSFPSDSSLGMESLCHMTWFFDCIIVHQQLQFTEKATQVTAKTTLLKRPRVKVTAVSGFIEQAIKEIKTRLSSINPSQPSS